MKRVVLEVGHGGRDSGAVGPGDRYEKNDNLLIALKVAERLRYSGVAVTLTRDKDVYISNNEKCSIERLSDCKCTIAFHRNGSNNVKARGYEAWVHSAATAKTITWATAIASEIYRTTEMPLRQNGVGVGRGMSGDPKGNYYWNSGTRSPSMLIELGFITNAEDNELFDTYANQYADIITKATCEYLGVVYKAMPEAKKIVYVVQVGSYRIKSNAELMLADLERAGYEAYIVSKEED